MKEIIVTVNKKGFIVKVSDEGLLKAYAECTEDLIRCRDCKHRDPEDHKCDSGHAIQWQLPRPDDWFCADGERKV